MKIAAITDDGKTISQHFGRAQYYLVVSVENGQVTQREMRPKLGHNHFSSQPHEEHGHGHGHRHGQDAAAHERHMQMAEAIRDCEVLLCRGMGRGAYESIKQLNIRPIVTTIADIDEAVAAYLSGQIVDHPEKLH